MEDIKKVLGVFLTCQSIIHQIDELNDSVLFKREFKQRTNSYLRFLEVNLNGLNREMDLKESQYYIDVVSKIDKLINEIELEYK